MGGCKGMGRVVKRYVRKVPIIGRRKANASRDFTLAFGVLG